MASLCKYTGFWKRRKINSYAVDEACSDLSLDIKCDKLQRTMHRKGQKAGEKSDWKGNFFKVVDFRLSAYLQR